jgi:hypothetical protein
LAAALSHHCEAAVATEITGGGCGLAASDPIEYQIRNLCLSKKPAVIRTALSQGDIGETHIAHDDQVEEAREAARRLVRRAIWGGLVSQATTLGGVVEASLPTVEMADIRILGGKLLLQRVKPHVVPLFCRDLRFTMSLSLSGPWWGGLLRSYGYGYIAKARAAAQRNAYQGWAA